MFDVMKKWFISNMRLQITRDSFSRSFINRFQYECVGTSATITSQLLVLQKGLKNFTSETVLTFHKKDSDSVDETILGS